MDNDFLPKLKENRWELSNELKLSTHWEKEGVYKFDPSSKKPIFSIDTPPPTVSGKMHIGHSFSYSQQDFVARYKRMLGFNVFYPFGTDDNGLATERMIEKMKNVKGVHMDRDEFVKLCEKTLEEIRPDFVNDWKLLGVSADYSIFYSTIDAHCRSISQKSFIELYEKGYEYQKEAPTIWCPTCHTAIAQMELQDKEQESTLNQIIFKVGRDDLVIATTRPEMLGSCVAVFAHPSDTRYQKLFGKRAKVPLFNHEVPILADERADPTKGTGAVMCCTFGDQTDIELFKAHNLPLVMSIDKSGLMTEKAGSYKGFKIKDARKKVLEDLRSAGLLIKDEKIKHVVNTHERCGTEIEILNTKQWFVKYLHLKEKFLELGARLKWHPVHMKNRYDNWIKGLQWDWCISRQRFFGVPFPVWYCQRCSNVMLADVKDLPVDPMKDKPKKRCSCGSSEFAPEKDVMDTWATSSLTPQIAASLFPKLYSKLYPMNLRPQAHDIITFWLFNTIVKSYLHNDVLPWNDVIISGWVLDANKEKMSKSKGNVIAPQEVISKYGADALRLLAATEATFGSDIGFNEERLAGCAKFIQKLYNISRFISSFPEPENAKPTETDRWILSELNRTIAAAESGFNNFDFFSANAVRTFTWEFFASNYLELVKPRAYNRDGQFSEAEQHAAWHTLHTVLKTVLKLLAPVTPYVTDYVWTNVYSEKSVHLQEFPKFGSVDEKDLALTQKLIEFNSSVWKEKREKGLALSAPIAMNTPAELAAFSKDLKAMHRLVE